MNRSRFSLLLIAIVLTCPYLCIGDALAVSVCAEQVVACGCTQGTPGQENPGNPAESSPDCLCHGAVVDGNVRTVHLDWATQVGLSWFMADVGSSLCRITLASIAFEPAHQFPPFPTGRDLCALTCTFLI